MSPEIIITICGIAAAFIGTWSVMKWRLDSYGAQLQKQWDWKDAHEKEAAHERLTLYQNISKLEGVLEAKSKENLEIMRKLEHIESSVIEMREDMADMKARMRLRDS